MGFLLYELAIESPGLRFGHENFHTNAFVTVLRIGKADNSGLV